MAKNFNKAVVNKSKKGVRIKNKTELVQFLNAYGVAKQMKFFASLLLPNNYKFKLHFSVGEDSYTDFKNITIGIPESMCGRTKEEILSDAKWRTSHEVGHLLYTNHEVWAKFMNDFATYMENTYKINKSISMKVAQNIINAAEDGREEHMMVIDNPGLLKYFTFGRGLWWYANEIKSVETGTELIRELYDTLFTIATLATMGTLPKNYADIYGEDEELFDMIKKMKVSINHYVNDSNPVHAINYLWTLVDTIEDWLVNLIKQIPEDDLNDTMNQLNQNAGANGSPVNKSAGSAGNGNQQGSSNGQSTGTDNTGNGNQQGSSNGKDSDDENQTMNGNGQNQGSNNQLNPIHKAFSGNTEETTEADTTTTDSNNVQNGGRIDYVEDNDDTDFETDMDKIVEDGIRNHQKEIIEDEYENVTQAEWDDMLHDGQIGDEESGNYDEELANEIDSYYQTLDRNKRGGYNWNVGMKVKHYNYTVETTPNSIRLEAKKLNKEFAEIFLNKRGFDSRNRRRGRLYVGDLHKLWINDYAMFEKKGSPRETDYVFYLLMDGSGSMSGKKFNEALRACSLVEEALKGIAPVKIVMFDYNSEVVHRVIKDFNEVNQSGNYSWTFAQHQYAGGCNMDGYSIRVATKELEKRHETRKVLITLSDGLPNGPAQYSGTRGENDVSEAVTSARSAGLSLFNIYFAETTSERLEYLPGFKKMYNEKGIISCQPKEIGTELLRVIKRELKR